VIDFDSLYMVNDLTSLKVLIMSYGGYRRNDSYGPKPVESGKEYDVQITEISRKGDGIARIQGRSECKDTSGASWKQIRNCRDS